MILPYSCNRTLTKENKMNDLKECITSQDYVETFDKLENAGITEVRIAFSDLFEREDDGKRCDDSIDFIAFKFSEKTLNEIDKRESINPYFGDNNGNSHSDEIEISGSGKGESKNVKIPNLNCTEKFIYTLVHPPLKEYENFDDDKQSSGYFYWNVSSRTITLHYNGFEKFRAYDPDNFCWWSLTLNKGE